MPDYMILIREDEAEQQRMAPSQTQALVEGHAAYVQSLKASGAYRDSERLRPSAEGKRVYRAGAVGSTTGKPVYRAGAVGSSTGKPVYRAGAVGSSTGKPVYRAGAVGSTTGKPVYRAGAVGSTTGKPVYRAGAVGSSTGKPVDARKVEAGPFGEAQALAGYYLVRADSLDAALALAEACPMAPGDTLDVRPLIKGDVRADKTSRQGKTFAFAVLGNAASEQAWVDVMDRIDADTHDGFPDERFLGGVRLEAPGRGRQIVSQGPRRTVMDGPFLESKEVIGGLFFMRMADLDEAVRWASATRFMRHGALEIRELWRS